MSNKITEFGSFRVLKQIGRGAFGVTYLGEHALLGAPVCIKQRITSKDPDEDRQLAAMFRREAELLWKMTHPRLPSAVDYLELPTRDDEGRPVTAQVIVLKFIEGVTLQDYIDKNGPVTDEHAFWILDRLLDALCYLHYGGMPIALIHSDIKPANIILNVDAHEATLIDFGLSVANPVDRTRAIGGTTEYMPPEFRNGLPPVPGSDFYSLGLTAIFMTGGNVRTSQPPADMDPRFAALLDELTAHDARQRPRHAGELRQRLMNLRFEIFGRTTTGDEKIAHRRGIAAARSIP